MSRLLQTLFRGFIVTCILSFFSVAGAQSNEDGSYHSKAADLVIQGSIFELNGEFEKALNAFNEALIYEPNSASIAFAVAKDYVRLGKLETAIQMLKRSVSVDGDFVESRRLLASIYHRKNQTALAKKQYLEIVRIDPKNIDAHLNLGAIYLADKEPRKAAEHYSRLVEMEQANSEIQFQLGNLYFQNKEFELALETFQGFIQSFPELEQGYLAIGAVLIAQKDTSGAINWYEKTHRENRGFKSIRDELANTFVVTKNWDAAIKLYTDAVSADTTDILLQLRLGELYLAKGDTVQAVSVLERLGEIDPREWRSYYRLGQIYLSDNRFEESIPYFEKTVKLNKSLADPWFKLGAAYERNGALDKAESSYREAQKLAPQFPWINFYLGNLLLRQNKLDEAIHFLSKSVDGEPENSAFISTLASAYDAAENHAKSEEYYTRALELDPNNPTILNNFSYSLAERRERLDEALGMATMALEKEPENGSFLDTMGWIYFQLDDYDKALEYIKKSVEVRDNSAEVFEHLGDVYDKLGHSQLAVQSWQEARERDPERQSVLIKLGIN